ncbi:Retrovirus-related Pol polyprotein from transposon TNT 1-94 [Vitis vinifera]|uniref:Retrovirus-related Pol polyprotein from transposon TNT 1-94 n=1 Tax=Vitis vinifera TaxID=29760 RepID=A0A438H355_VITVI|nr:Retrovirus-related Pol polyprotein from transposon TNT 1-94 [Vitis vinifera]
MQARYRVWEIIYLPQVGCFTLGGGAVSWGSKKQTCISHSTMEAEFIVLAATRKEAEWLRDLMMDIPFTANNVSTVSIHCDSQATLARAYSGVYNGKSRHISIRHEVKLKAFNEIQSMCDKHLKAHGHKSAKQENNGTRVVSGSGVLLSVSLQGITGSMLQATWDFNGAL